MIQVALLKQAVKQFAHPTRDLIERASSWTMRPPRKADSPCPSSLQVLLSGRFYIYQASESRVQKLNREQNMEYEAGSHDLSAFMQSVVVLQVNKCGGVTIHWNNNIIGAHAP